MDANQTVSFRTPWGATPGIPRRVGYPQGSMSTAWRSKFPQDPLLRWLEAKGIAYQLREPSGMTENARLGAAPTAPVGRSYSDDTRLWSTGWEGLQENARIISSAAPRLGIGLKASKMFARGNEAAGPAPDGGLWIYSWAEPEGEVRADEVMVTTLGDAKELLGVPKARSGEGEEYGHKTLARTCARLNILPTKKLAWDELRAAAQLGGASMLQYAPVHAKVQHEQARRMDAIIHQAARKGTRLPQHTTPYGLHAAEDKGGLGTPSMVVERAGAVARELCCTLNSDMEEGEVIRWVWEAEVLFRVGRRIPSWVWSVLKGCQRKDICSHVGRHGRQGRASEATPPRHRRASRPRSVREVENGRPDSQYPPRDMDQCRRDRPRAARNLGNGGGINQKLEDWRAPGHAEEVGNSSETGPGTTTTGLEAPSAYGRP